MLLLGMYSEFSLKSLHFVVATNNDPYALHMLFHSFLMWGRENNSHFPPPVIFSWLSHHINRMQVDKRKWNFMLCAQEPHIHGRLRARKGN